jgi:hypothetical protein
MHMKYLVNARCFAWVVAASVAAASAAGGVAGCVAVPSDAALEAEQTELSQRSVPVDFPNKSRAVAPQVPGAAAAPVMKYFGGPVIPNPKVYVVWWGDPAKLSPAVTAAKGGIADFYAGITNSKYMDSMNEYNTDILVQAGSRTGSPGTGQRIGRGNYAGTITLKSVPAGNVTDPQVQATIDRALDAGILPAPDDNTIYAIYFPRNVTISIPGSGSSCRSFGAYHFSTTETVRHNAYYLVMPDCGNSFSGVTRVSSHELNEAVTDAIPTPGSSPEYPQAWNNAGGSEVGDLCERSSGSVSTPFGAFTVQGFWDEITKACVVTRAYGSDYSVSFANTAANLAVGVRTTFTLQTSVVAGVAQPLTLSVVAPAGVTAELSQTRVNAGASVVVTVTASTPAAAAQVVVRAEGTTGAAPQSHTAALLLNVK